MQNPKDQADNQINKEEKCKSFEKDLTQVITEFAHYVVHSMSGRTAWPLQPPTGLTPKDEWYFRYEYIRDSDSETLWKNLEEIKIESKSGWFTTSGFFENKIKSLIKFYQMDEKDGKLIISDMLWQVPDKMGKFIAKYFQNNMYRDWFYKPRYFEKGYEQDLMKYRGDHAAFNISATFRSWSTLCSRFKITVDRLEFAIQLGKAIDRERKPSLAFLLCCIRYRAKKEGSSPFGKIPKPIIKIMSDLSYPTEFHLEKKIFPMNSEESFTNLMANK